ncbi:MAG: peptidylprolyl isomerase [Pelagibacteraceae bacterium]|jgi:cyclophilin family peptidyl-prolyl cis-trans isomerase|tara:strand:+ start:242 stop:802 length:561 start_codon:yes stop_codon:yes gene_type:complete
MKLKKIIIFLFFLNFSIQGLVMANSKITIKLKNGDVKIELFDDIAPNHVKRILDLSKQGKYDGVAFHRVIDGFMAQTGDVKHGNTKNNFNPAMVGTGGSDLPDLKAEFNDVPHERGVLSMARSQNPNSANSQFFICFDTHPHLDRQYTVFGKVISGMEFVDQIKKGAPGSGVVNNPDIIEKIIVEK